MASRAFAYALADDSNRYTAADFAAGLQEFFRFTREEMAAMLDRQHRATLD